MSDLAGLVNRLEQVAGRLESVAARGVSAGGAAPAAAAAGGSGGDGNASIDGFDEILNGAVADFVGKSTALGGNIATMGGLVEDAFRAQREFLVVVSKSKQPAQSELPGLLEATSKAIGAIQSLRDTDRKSNHLSGVSEGIPALGWVTMAPKPCPYIKEMTGSAQFYTNRVLKEFKGTDEQHVEWAKSFVAILTELHDYVKAVHTTGPAWNPQGAAAAKPATAAPAAKPAATKPAVKPAGGGADVRGGLFAALNKGGDVTSGLKKVDRSQMTHKNPELRASSVVPASAAKPKAASSAPKYGGAAAKKDPVLMLDGKKWKVEFQEGNREIVIDDVELSHTVYIYKCNNSTIQIKGKVNSITCDGCKKTAVVFDNAVSSFEFINCQSMQVQVNGKVPTVTIDKTDGAQVYLSKESMETEIVSAKSSEMNISLPVGNDGEFNEFAVPEQFKTVWDGSKLVTTNTDIAG